MTYTLYVHFSLEMITGVRPKRRRGNVCAAIACYNTAHNSDVRFFRFPNENDGDRYVLISPQFHLIMFLLPAFMLHFRILFLYLYKLLRLMGLCQSFTNYVQLAGVSSTQ